MSSFERSKRASHLPSWRSNEQPAGLPDSARLRGPVIRPSDFVDAGTPSSSFEPAGSPVAHDRLWVEEPEAAAAPQDAVIIEPSAPAQSTPVEPARPEPAAAAQSFTAAAGSGGYPAGPHAPLLDLRSAVGFVWLKRRLVLALLAAGALAGACLVPLLPQKFTAETSLYFDPRQAVLSQDQQAAAAPEFLSTMIDSQTQILGSGKVLGRVVDALRLADDPRFNGGTSGDTARSVAVASLQKAVQIAREASTYVVSLKVTTGDPQQSARIANEIVTAFGQEESTATAGLYQNANTALDGRLDELRRQVLEADKAVEDFRAANDMAAVGGDLIADKRLASLNELLVAAQQRTIEARARAEAADKLRFEDVVSNGRPDAAGTSTALANLRQQYSQQAAVVGSLESQLGARHPRLLAARSSLESVAGEIRSELERLAGAARADYQQAQRAEQDLAKELTVQKAAQANRSDKLVELNELQRKAGAARDLYEALMKRSGQTGDAQNLTQTNIRVISEAEPPLKADGPGRKILMIAGLIAGALSGAGLGAAVAVFLGLLGHPLLRSYLPKDGRFADARR